MSLFGAPQNATPAATNTNNTAATGASLFGNLNTGNNNNTTGASLFGATANKPATITTTGSSLFGNTTNAASTTNSLFGAPAANNTATVAAPSGSSLFGAAPQANAQTMAQPQQNAQSDAARMLQSQATQLQTGLGSTMQLNSLSATQQQDLARSRLQQFGIDHRTNTKTIFEQTKTLISKWDPNSQDTLMQAYLYNAVNAAYAPFYHRNPDEDEKSWEAALADKPQPSEGAEGQQISYVPVLVRGFKALGERMEYQVNVVNQMRARLHEMNNSLAAVMAAHQQRVSVKIEASKRLHVALAQRTLRLAVKVQVLRSRGYALDASEESLRQLLMGLERQVMDPGFLGREEEIWARMVALRERSRWLEEEGKRLGQQTQAQERGAMPEEVLLKTKKILSDYESQLAHLNRELGDVKREFSDWSETQTAQGAGR